MLFTPPMFIYIISVARRRHEDCLTEDRRVGQIYAYALLCGFLFFMPNAIGLFDALFCGGPGSSWRTSADCGRWKR